MEQIMGELIALLPNLAGFIVVTFILARQNEKLIDAALKRIDELEVRMQAFVEGYSAKK